MNEDVKVYFDKKAEIWDATAVKEETWLRRFIKDYVPIKQGMRVLDLGCGTGAISKIIYDMSKTKVIGLDISSAMIDIAKSKYVDSDIDFYCEDYYETVKTGFDMIVCYNAYPHFGDVLKFKDKTSSLLNPNGYLVVLHSFSRQKLSQIHQGLSISISRNLKSVQVESAEYLNEYNVVNNIDNDDMFMMLLQKK